VNETLILSPLFTAERSRIACQIHDIFRRDETTHFLPGSNKYFEKHEVEAF